MNDKEMQRNVVGQGRELYDELVQSVKELLSASKEPERWGCVGSSAEDIAWQEFLSIASHICTGIDSPPAQPTSVPLTDEQRKNLWVSATVESPSHENCYYRGLVDAEAYHGITTPEKG